MAAVPWCSPRGAPGRPGSSVGALAVAEPGMEEGDPDREVGSEPVDQRHRQRDLGNEDEGRATALERGDDRLDVDRGLAAAGDAVEQERGRVAAEDRGARGRDRLGLGRCEGSASGAASPETDRTSRERTARPFTHLDLDEAAPDEARDGRRPVVVAEGGAGQAGIVRRRARVAGGVCGQELREGGDLARSERPPNGALTGFDRLRYVATGIGQADPALVARAGSGREQRPVERHEPGIGKGPEPPDEGGPAFGSDEVADRTRPALELVEQVELGGRQVRRRGGGPLGQELEALEQAGWQHRPEDKGRRGEVVIRDPAGQGESERRQERAVGADPTGDRLGDDPRRRRCVAEDDPERLASPELDEHGLAGLETRQRRRDGVGIATGAAAAGRVDRDLDVTDHSLRPGRGGSGGGGAPWR